MSDRGFLISPKTDQNKKKMTGSLKKMLLSILTLQPLEYMLNAL